MVSAGSEPCLQGHFTQFDVAINGIKDVADQVAGTGGALDDVLELLRCDGIAQLGLDGKTGSEAPQIVEAITIDQPGHLIGKNGIEGGTQLPKGHMGLCYSAHPGINFLKTLVVVDEIVGICGCRIRIGVAKGSHDGGIFCAINRSSSPIASSPDEFRFVDVAIKRIGCNEVDNGFRMLDIAGEINPVCIGSEACMQGDGLINQFC